MFKTSEHKGGIALLFAALLYSTSGLFTRLLGEQLGTFSQLTLRLIFTSLFFLLFILITKSFKEIHRKDLPILLFRGFLIIADFYCFIHAVSNLPLGLTLFIFYASTTIVNYIFGKLVFHEQITKKKLISLGLAFGGMILLYGGNFGELRFIPMLAALCSGALFGINSATSKLVTGTYSEHLVGGMAYLVATVLSAVFFFLTQEAAPSFISLNTWYICIGFAFVVFLAFYLTMYGYKYLEVQKASIIMLSELVFTVIVGFIFYKEIPNVSTVIGGLFIAGAMVIPELLSE
jgi:drug/metabolite transporter (DMT)-like permease